MNRQSLPGATSPPWQSLAKEGWLRPSTKYGEASLAGRRRGGSFKPPIIGIERTTPFLMFRQRAHAWPRFSKERGHFLDRRPPPPLPSFAKEGLCTTIQGTEHSATKP